MAQTSRLVLEIDSRDAEQKAADTRKALEALEGAGLRAKPVMDKLADGIDSVGQSSKATGKKVKTSNWNSCWEASTLSPESWVS